MWHVAVRLRSAVSSTVCSTTHTIRYWPPPMTPPVDSGSLLQA